MANHRVDALASFEPRYSGAGWEASPITKADCHEMGDVVADGLEKFERIQANIKLWRQRVFTGQIEFRDDIDAALRGDLQAWLEFTDSHVLPIIAEIEKAKHLAGVSRAHELRTVQLTARRLLTEWHKPVLSRTVSLRMDKLSEEETAKVFASLREASARPTLTPCRISADS